MARIFLSIPVLDRPELKMLYSTYQAMLSCRQHQIRVYFNENDSLISRVRNVHISTFLNDYPECEYFMSLDSDLEIINAFASNNIFSKLVSHDKDFVGGLYPLKQSNSKPLCSSIPMEKGITRDSIPFDKGLLEMRWLSSGCWCLKRSAVEKMVKAYPELTYVGDDNVAGKPIYGLFKPDIFEIEDGGATFRKYLSEDWAFCERWRSIGGQIFSDTSVVLKHIGKTSYCLWNVEVVTTKKEPVEAEVPLQAPQARQTEQTPQPVQTIAHQEGSPIGKDLPPAGYDLLSQK